MKKFNWIIMIAAIALFLAACAKDAPVDGEKADKPASAPSLKVLKNDKTGEYLADAKGMTLYYFKKDETGKSNCSGDCLKNWPAFTDEDFTAPDGYDQNDFGTIDRDDSDAKQVTYKGFPLYYFVNDKAEGDVNGEGVKDVWYIVNKDTVFP